MIKFKPEEGEVQVRCKYNPENCATLHLTKNIDFNCKGIDCVHINTITWSRLLINKKHFIEVKND